LQFNLYLINGDIFVVNYEQIEEFNHEQVIFCSNKEAGLRAIIAIYNTKLGLALGGTRVGNYKNDDEALKDVLRFSNSEK